MPRIRRYTIVVLVALIVVSLPTAAHAADRLSLAGYGSAKWGMTPAEVEAALGVTLDCSGGVSPGSCICPEITPDLPVTLAFGNGEVLVAAYSYESAARSTRGARRGMSIKAIRRKYRGARVVRGRGLGGGLSDYVVVRGNGHALAFPLTGRGRVAGIFATSYSAVDSELCA